MAHSLKDIVALYRYKVVFIHNVLTALYMSVTVWENTCSTSAARVFRRFAVHYIPCTSLRCQDHCAVNIWMLTCIHSVVDMTSYHGEVARLHVWTRPLWLYTAVLQTLCSIFLQKLRISHSRGKEFTEEA